jgi:prophage maintenance system killer protein
VANRPSAGFSVKGDKPSLLLARWTLDRNGIDLPADDRAVAELLVQAAAGREVEEQLVELFRSRAEK